MMCRKSLGSRGSYRNVNKEAPMKNQNAGISRTLFAFQKHPAPPSKAAAPKPSLQFNDSQLAIKIPSASAMAGRSNGYFVTISSALCRSSIPPTVRQLHRRNQSTRQRLRLHASAQMTDETHPKSHRAARSLRQTLRLARSSRL